ncbi:type III effector [Noviherbaspirillum sedimenti]|uniref:Type III effector n=2 Tax=Noviherbaspirillum sedimenti TaxID=2320865 RepID=A0A3A3G5S8_9BURK|nr:type III effector [Noviherbaspirillum sedimenti]
MDIPAFLKKLDDMPEAVAFTDTMAVIEAVYAFTPAAFTNGSLRNEAGQNSGSCKLFAFALLNQLSEQQTLACFGAYYRDDVLKHPEATDHQNIRNFMTTGWAGVKFESMPLTAK